MEAFMNRSTRQKAIDLYDRFTHEGTDRRAFMTEMVKLAGSPSPQRELMIAGIAASPAAAAIASRRTTSALPPARRR